MQTSDKTILYSVASALVNCTNSYDTKELVPELVQLAKFSKQHVPEEHPKVGWPQLGSWEVVLGSEGFLRCIRRHRPLVSCLEAGIALLSNQAWL